MGVVNRNEAQFYFTRVYNHFQTKHKEAPAVTLDEWSCIQRWREEGMDVGSVIKGIDRAFAQKGGAVTSLLECDDTVRKFCKSVP